MILQSDDITLLMPDLIKSKKEFKKVIFDKSGNRNNYASIGAILNATEEALLSNNITLIPQEHFDFNNKVPYLFLKLMHKSGQWIGSHAVIRLESDGVIKSANQQYGAALSYTLRYSLRTLLGLYADNDDIDNYDHHKKYLDTDQVNALKKLNPDTIKNILSYNKVSSLEELTLDQYERFKRSSKDKK